MSGNVTIDINNRPGGGVEKDDKGYYYESDGGGIVNLTSAWYPELEGTYRKLTHTPKNGQKISTINKGGTPQEGFTDLSSYSSVSVYYWSGDNGFSKPLLIQLGTGDNECYTTTNGNNWGKDSGITSGNLREKLNKQNCGKNKAHVVDLSQKKNNHNYQCPGCQIQRINVFYSSIASIISSTHSIGRSISVTSFKNSDTWQRGLPSLKDVSTVMVYWNGYGNTPLIIAQQAGKQRFFRKNKDYVNSWIEVSTGQNDLPDGETPTLATLDLSRPAGTYNDGVGNINVTVRNGSIGDGYWRYQYSLCGGLFKVTQVSHNNALLTGVSSQDPLYSISAYYYADILDLEKLLLIELRSSGSSKYTYVYFHRSSKAADEWSNYPESGGETTRLQGNDLTQKLKKEQLPDTRTNPSSTSEFKDHDSISNKSTSPIGPAIGGTVSVLVALVAMVLLVKFWPKIRTRFVGIWNGFGIHKKRKN
ncbi:hypothetical protein BEWA_002060 [Theileria equi strain WA]|uniref:Uncharacterized protein n=1 Tax=Theileria equi strain WA TaxID=1537102 RepID=L0B0Y6_THEEQ|nr:hypothetical protein BEWA_002060 [Theileria equi strain WA]AFZ80799.1 hypothetical protein BEWA_002060 [Theileria equi strain WA]|eukprot:XP_004830465.1 hypothetical protein BEWA_002060 [Theileria equi strain WA]